MAAAPVVLVVDDDEDNARLLEDVLVEMGFAVRIADSVERARAALAAGGVDALVTDFSLGDGDAIDLMSSLGSSRPSVAVLVTGFGSRKDRERFEAGGFDACLVKPIDLEQLERALRPARRERKEPPSPAPRQPL